MHRLSLHIVLIQSYKFCYMNEILDTKCILNSVCSKMQIFLPAQSYLVRYSPQFIKITVQQLLSFLLYWVYKVFIKQGSNTFLISLCWYNVRAIVQRVLSVSATQINKDLVRSTAAVLEIQAQILPPQWHFRKGQLGSEIVVPKQVTANFGLIPRLSECDIQGRNLLY